MRRRSFVGWLGLAVTTGTMGCVDSGEPTNDSRNSSEPTNDSQSEGSSCDKYVSTATDDDGQLPWHLGIRNISLETFSVSISISDISGGTPERVVSCTAASENHSKLVFDLAPNTEYRVDVTLNRRRGSETASTTVTGWNRVTGTNESLEVTVEDGEFRIRRVHYDSGAAPRTA